MNILLVAGRSTEELSKFLSSKESIEVKKAVSSLCDYQEMLFSSLIEVDKVVMLDNFKDHVSMMQEFVILKKLVTSEYFNTREILYLGVEKNLEYVDFLTLQLNDANFPKENYVIKIDVEHTRSNIYNYVLGLDKEIVEETNTRIAIYMRKKLGNKSLVYDPDFDDRKKYIPLDFNAIKKYEDKRRDAFKILPDKIIEDEKVERARGQYLQKLDPFEVFDPFIIKEDNIVLVTGERVSGKTTLLIGLATSAVKCGKRVLIIDLQENNSTSNNLEILETRMNILKLSELKGEGLGSFQNWLEESANFKLNAISTSDMDLVQDGKDITIELLYSKIPKSYFDVVFIDFPLPRYRKHLKYVINASKIVISTSLRYNGIMSTIDLINNVKDENFDEKEKIFVPACMYEKIGDSGYLTARELNRLVTEEIVNSVSVSEIKLKGLNVGEELYSSLLGV